MTIVICPPNLAGDFSKILESTSPMRYTVGQTLFICNGSPVKVIHPGSEFGHRVLVEMGDGSREWRTRNHLWETQDAAIKADRAIRLEEARAAMDKAWWAYYSCREKWIDLGGVETHEPPAASKDKAP